MSDMRKAQSHIMEIARKNLQKHDEVHMRTEPISLTEFPLNTYVLVEHRHNSLRKGPSSKLLPYLKGPLRVINSNGSKYTLQDIVTKRNKDYHVSRIREFNFDPATQDPLTYALRDDHQWYAVDKISHMRGDPKGLKSKLAFKVHWVGEEKPTWEPWKSIRRTKQLHDFLTNHDRPAVRELLPAHYVDGDDNAQELEAETSSSDEEEGNDTD